MAENIEQLLREQGQKLFQAFLLEKIALLEALRERFGPEVIDIVNSVENERTRQNWEVRGGEPGGIPELIKTLCGAGGYEYTMEEKDGGIQLCFTRCPHQEWAQKNGVADWAYHLICAKDPFIAEGFNPRIGFRRTKTLMQGHDCCDHFYFMKK